MPPPPLLINDDDDVVTVTPDLDHPEVTCPITTVELQGAMTASELSSSFGLDGHPLSLCGMKNSKTTFYILLMNRRRCSPQNTTFH